MHNGGRPVPRPPHGGIVWRLAGERLALLAWPRAILMQLAHPLVAAGVGDHSRFQRSALSPFSRLYATVRSMRRLTFGSDAEAADAMTRILRIHDRVHGTLTGVAGASGTGTRYSAHDPALLLWVHATLVDSYVRVLGEVLRPLDGAGRDAYCAETAPFAEALGARPAEVPRDWETLQRYIQAQIADGDVCVSEQARILARGVLRPALGWTVWPVRQAGELITIGSLPDAIRAQYGFSWSAARERRRRRLLAVLRGVRSWMPDLVARWPEARRRLLGTTPRRR